MRLGGPFISPRDLGAVGAPFGRPWLPSVWGCTRLFDAYRTLHSAMATNPLIGWFPVLGALDRSESGTGLLGEPCDRWLQPMCPLAVG
jgi:hypothetical protein